MMASAQSIEHSASIEAQTEPGSILRRGESESELLSPDYEILSDHLPLYPNKTPLYLVKVIPQYISWEPTNLTKRASISSRNSKRTLRRSSSILSLDQNKDLNIVQTRQAVLDQGGLFLHFEDIVGCDCMKGRVENDASAYVTIYAYPHRKKAVGKKTQRKRVTLTLTFNTGDTYDKNQEEANKWRNIVQSLVKRVSILGLTGPERANLQPPVSKKMLFLINPFSGKGKAVQLFKQRIVPVLAEAAISYETKITSYAGEARELMHSIDLTQFYGFVIVSGDGLIYEVVNGLMERPDWEAAIKTPVGCLPGGSGNALCCSISWHAEEPFLTNHILHASFTVAKHILKPMHLVAIDTGSGQRVYSFLSCVWGFMSDVDIESEKYRSIGEARFTLGAVIRIMGLRKYKGKVSFLPVDEYKPPSKKSLKRIQSTPATNSDLNNGHGSVNSLPRSQSMIESSTTGIYRSTSVEDNSAVDFNVEPQGLEKIDPNPTGPGPDLNPKSSAAANASQRKGPNLYIPPLGQPLPPGWVTLEDEFVNIGAFYLSHLNKAIIAAPDSRFEDDMIYLSICHSGVGRMTLLNAIGAMEKGEQIESEHVELIKVRAFRIEPEGTEGIMTVDGERIDYGPVQGQILPAMMNVMVPNKGKFLSK